MPLLFVEESRQLLSIYFFHFLDLRDSAEAAAVQTQGGFGKRRIFDVVLQYPQQAEIQIFTKILLSHGDRKQLI